MLGGTVWERRVPPDVNKWSNRTEKLSSLFPPYIRYNLVPVTRIAFRRDEEEDDTTRGRIWPKMCE